MSSTDVKGKQTGDKEMKSPTKEQIFLQFNKLRIDQTTLIEKIADVEHQLNEHSLVIDTLKVACGSQKCYRMIGGVLVERTVKEVLPAVVENRDKLLEMITTWTKQVEEKGKEINEFKEKYDIQIKREPSLIAVTSDGAEDNSCDALVEESS